MSLLKHFKHILRKAQHTNRYIVYLTLQYVYPVQSTRVPRRVQHARGDQGVAIMATSVHSNSKSSIIAHLTGRQKDSSKFSSSKARTDYSIHQNFALSNVCAIQYVRSL